MIPVRLETGLVIMHTREEYDRFWRGVDREVARAMVADMDEWLEEEPE